MFGLSLSHWNVWDGWLHLFIIAHLSRFLKMTGKYASTNPTPSRIDTDYLARPQDVEAALQSFYSTKVATQEAMEKPWENRRFLEFVGFPQFEMNGISRDK